MTNDQRTIKTDRNAALMPERSGQDFENLVSRYAKQMLSIAYRYTFDWESAKDICQDTWLRVYEKISLYDGRVPFERWLFAVHRNICLNFLRKKRIRREMRSEAGETELKRSVSRETAPDKDAELRQSRELILAAAAQLPDRQRTVFAMVDLEQMTIDEAAGRIGIKPVSIRTNLHHARKRIAGVLRGLEKTG
jgi:RNA polymerase sigma-70 factor (ECF subfamily)